MATEKHISLDWAAALHVLSKKRSGRVFVCLVALKEYFPTRMPAPPPGTDTTEPEVWCCVPRGMSEGVFFGSIEECLSFQGADDYLIIREDLVGERT